MDYQCLYRNDQDRYSDPGVWRGFGEKFVPSSCRAIKFEHISGENSGSIQMQDRNVTDLDVMEWFRGPRGTSVHSQLHILVTPSREVQVDEQNKVKMYNREAPLPFSQKTFYNIVEQRHLHKGFLSKHRHGQIARVRQESVVSYYIENPSHRDMWFKLFVSFDNKNQQTTAMIHNLLPAESEALQDYLKDSNIHPLTIHPMLLFVLIMQLLFEEIVYETRIAFGDSIRLKHFGELHTEDRFKHMAQENFDIKKAAANALGNEQKILGLIEKSEFVIRMGSKLQGWFEDLDCLVPNKEHRERFVTAGSIILNRVEYLVDGVELQLLRLKRAQGHSQLNKLGLESRNTALGNSLNYKIAEQNYSLASQSRDIARDSKRDSSAMKAIAVLTMFFLPGTFFATVFAMPLFDWEASSHSVMNRRFWIYCAVTIPVTALVLIVWRIWFVFDEWRRDCGKDGKLFRDFRLWMRSQRTKREGLMPEM